MASIRHDRVSLVDDDLTKPELVQPSEWNADHVIDDPAALRAELDVLSSDEVDAAIQDAIDGSGAVIANNSVTNAKLRDSVGVSVIGRSANSTGDPADIVATADEQFLQRVAGAVVWAALNGNLVALAALTGASNKIIRFTGLGTMDLLDFSTDSTLAANSDTAISSMKALKSYIDSVVTGGAVDVMIFKGVIDASANPNYPAADAGHVYKISVAGKIGGASGPNVEAGDTIYCITDSTASGTQAGVGANWVIAQVNIDGAVTGPTSATTNRIATFNGTTGKTIQDGGNLISDLILKSLVTTKGDLIVATASATPARIGVGTEGYHLIVRAAATEGIAWEAQYDEWNFIIDGGGSVITTGIKGDIKAGYAGTIVSAELLADQSGSIVVNIWKDTYANFPPDVADKITASAPPTISSATKATDSTLTGWTLTFAAGDIFRFNVDSVTTIQRATLALRVRLT